tara:strand:+ start:260 stop:1726 length:1467 start_codon:yes stop_codon:yes gene_type:complete
MYRCLGYHIAEIPSILNVLSKKQNQKIINIKTCIEKESLVTKLQNKFASTEILLSEQFTKSKSKYNKSIFLDENTIKFLNENLDDTLQIFSRYFIVNKFINYSQIKQHIYSLACQSINLIKTNKIDLIIFYQTPHHIDSYITFLISKQMNIKTIIIKQFSFFDEHRFCIDEDLNTFFSDLNNYKSNNERSRIKSKDFLEKFINKDVKDALYLRDNYIRNIKFLNKNNFFYYLYLDIKNFLFKHPKHHNGFYYWHKKDYFFENSSINNIKFIVTNMILRAKILILKLYYRWYSVNELPEKFITFFPNYQPEASTTPEASSYADIYLILNNLSSMIPANCKIIYKEHKTTFDYSRESFTQKNILFYRFLKKKFKNLIFYDFDCDKSKLIKNSQFIVTMTSNIAWEAMLNRKKVVITEGVWFDRFKGFVKIQELEKKKDYLLSKNELEEFYVSHFIEYCNNIEENSFSKLNSNVNKKEEKIESLLMKKIDK